MKHFPEASLFLVERKQKPQTTTTKTTNKPNPQTNLISTGQDKRRNDVRVSKKPCSL